METIDETKECIERSETRIKIIRQESKLLTESIARMLEQRKKLSEEKRELKQAIESAQKLIA